MFRAAISVLPALLLLASDVDAQLINSRTSDPRTADEKPDLNAPAPRSANGKPDLAGVWQVSVGAGYVVNIVADLSSNEILPWADELYRRRMSALGTDDPWTVECLPLGPRSITGGTGGAFFVRVVQASNMILMIYEDLAYRQIYVDGRTLPKNPNPSFMGYSVGRWEGDVLVVESVGFNDRTWLDFGGHPHTEALHITERYRRTTVGRMDVQVTFEDPGAYRRAWTVPVAVTLRPDSDLLEYVCNENEKRRTSLSGRTSEQQRISLPSSILAEYAGSYILPPTATLPIRSMQVRNEGGDLYLDVNGHGNILMVPLSLTTFSARIIDLEFKRDSSGAVTHVVLLRNGALLTKRR